MRQQQTFRGFVFLIMMLVLLAFAFKFTSTAGAGDRLTYQEFLQVLDTEKVEEAVISQNPQAYGYSNPDSGGRPDRPSERFGCKGSRTAAQGPQH